MSERLTERQRTLLGALNRTNNRRVHIDDPDWQTVLLELDAIGYAAAYEASNHSDGDLYGAILPAGRAALHGHE